MYMYHEHDGAAVRSALTSRPVQEHGVTSLTRTPITRST